MKKTPHELNLHEEIIISGTLSILRVPGGWIYSEKFNEDSWSNTFVPYSDEFNTNKEETTKGI